MTWIAPPFEEMVEPLEGSEREMLEGFLDNHHSSFLMRCSGLGGEQLAEREVPPSNLSLLGLVRHLTEVERNWFRRRFGGQDLSNPYSRADVAEAAFTEIDPAFTARDLDRLLAEPAFRRQSAFASDTGRRRFRDKPS